MVELVDHTHGPNENLQKRLFKRSDVSLESIISHTCTEPFPVNPQIR